MIIPIENDETQWAGATFGATSLGDKRHNARLVTMSAQLARRPDQSFHAAFEGFDAQRLAAYRFVENEKIQVEDIVAGGVEPVLQTLRERADLTILACEDTTNISYLHASPHDELGPIGGPNNSKMQGFLVHSVLAFDEASGEPLGLIYQEYMIRAKGTVETPHDQRVPEDRESYIWTKTSETLYEKLGTAMQNVVLLCDREADIYRLIDYKIHNHQRFVIRSKTNRRLTGHKDKLHEHLKKQPVRATFKLEIEQKKGRPQRVADVEIRAAQVDIQAPDKLVDVTRSTKLWALAVTEKNPPKGVKALEWKLLTSEDCSDVAVLRKIPTWYSQRWGIEEFHKIWKCGCKVEELQMQRASNLMRTASILAFIAVRIFRIEHFARTSPSASCREILDPTQLCCLWSKENPGKPLPCTPPTVAWAYAAIARLAGWSDSKRTGKASSITLWKGWQRLADLVLGQASASLLLTGSSWL